MSNRIYILIESGVVVAYVWDEEVAFKWVDEIKDKPVVQDRGVRVISELEAN